MTSFFLNRKKSTSFSLTNLLGNNDSEKEMSQNCMRYFLLFFSLSLFLNAQEESIPVFKGGVVEEFIAPIAPVSSEVAEVPSEQKEQMGEDLDLEEEQKIPPYCDPCQKWYFTFKPGYLYFTNSEMRRFFNDGGFSFRLESGCRVYKPLIVWLDMGYFQKEGAAIGGGQRLDIKLGSITIGLKAIHYFADWAAIYLGAGPRLMLMHLKNDAPFIRADDRGIGFGLGSNCGFWLFPIPAWKNFYIDAFADYSYKELSIDEDEFTSVDNDVDVSSLTAGIGIGIRF